MHRKISVVTPVFNGEEFIEKCILSIKNQNYDNYEHIIIDGGSTDNTLTIVKKYEKEYPVKIVSEKDNGMYDAIVKGFSIATGEIFAWLNADDTYLPWAFQIMNYTVDQGVNWATCMNAIQNKNDVIYQISKPYYYRGKWLRKGYYDGRVLNFVQQESTFWTSELWRKSEASKIIGEYKLAGDFALWREFSKFEKLYTVKTVIGSFRKHDGQKSADIDVYYDEIEIKEIKHLKKFLLIILAIGYCRIFPLFSKNCLNEIDVDYAIGEDCDE